MHEGLLKSWNAGATRQAIIAFVARVTLEDGPDYVPPAARIAVFDNDGCLWCEKPMPIQAGFLLRRIAEQAEADPSLRDRQPWKAVHEKDQAWLGDVITKHYEGDDTTLKEMAAGLLSAYAEDDVESFASKADQFLRSAENPVLKRPYLKTAYAPMRELLQYLEANQFTNYIVSGGGRDFMRPITRELYGVPPERVVGTTVALQYREEDGIGKVVHTSKLEVFDDGPNKVVRIWSRIGARPIFAAGNSNGDIQMLQFATQGKGASLALLVTHDDDEREIAYTSGAQKSVALAKERGWPLVSVREDWAKVFVD
ncbi:HAD family hydrolase [Stenotrophomonas sp. SORGH_AS_0282]|uniref:HAD family hydrolase n=1 Tax=Stenotrophomonas sp. SORGH_AS_0282 TaxID=3041763 RepID=UPI002782859D|nr:HAD family hydrolase [Stenotrophomonas sp. SORGH_AS_0282]MDQ1064366.1 phosphoserine phosphatase [Stenotrophomonas sp. SORGH_AS_0282]MDQ1191001.1 phosphoserine phosphatase [Stenotrophomonas sp. SORGH_AS_0282]